MHQRPRQAEPDAPTRTSIFERDGADGLEVALEHGIDDRRLDSVASKRREAFADRVGASSNHSEVDEADLRDGLGVRAPA